MASEVEMKASTVDIGKHTPTTVVVNLSMATSDFHIEQTQLLPLLAITQGNHR